MANYGNHAAFYKEVFAAAVEAGTGKDLVAEIDEKKKSESICEEHQPLPREEFLKTINYASQNYDARRRALRPVLASVTSYF